MQKQGGSFQGLWMIGSCFNDKEGKSYVKRQTWDNLISKKKASNSLKVERYEEKLIENGGKET